ncbi:MAG: hypothetical protein U0Z17_03695 [Bacteroidales bacterium]
MGNLVKATDNGGNVVYRYHSSEQTKSISAVGATTYTDAYGRQITLTDPDAGTTRYAYNAFGELASQTNANNYRIPFITIYWAGVTQKTLGTDVTTYVYNTSGPALGTLLAPDFSTDATKQEYNTTAMAV